MRRRRLPAVALVLLALAVGACGIGDDEPTISRQALEQRLSERLGASPEESTCVVDYLMQDYSSEELRVIHDDGLQALPQGAWESYFTSTVACLTQPPPPS